MLYTLKYTDDMPEGTGGFAKFWFIRIRPKYKDDKGIHEHEIEHVNQFWILAILFPIALALSYWLLPVYYDPFSLLFFFAHPLLYKFSKKYRQGSEVKAYRKQLQNPPASGKDEYRQLYAQYISEDYNLTITKEQGYKLLGE